MFHIICGASPRCGFRVHQDYFREKTRFMPGICPSCGGPIRIVDAYTERVAVGMSMKLSGEPGIQGQIVNENDTEVAAPVVP